MADVYASAVGTAVLQLKEIPPRPADFDGAICLFDVHAGKDANSIRDALLRFGRVVSVDTDRDPVLVRFSTHEEALAAKGAGAPSLCKGIDTLYNERPYDERGWCAGGEEFFFPSSPPARLPDHSPIHPPNPKKTRSKSPPPNPLALPRCCLESAVSSEPVARLSAYPKMKAVLDTLPPKMLSLASGEPPVPVELEVGGLASRVEENVSRIQKATFTGKGDKETVPSLYREYVEKLTVALQATLAFAADEGAVDLPPMPAVHSGGDLSPSAFEELLTWHKKVLLAQHSRIADALSGRLLRTLEDCVPIRVTGSDASGKALNIKDASTTSEWLLSLRGAGERCSVLTAGPAAGKTWLMSQIVMHSLGGELVVVLIKVERLAKRLLENEAFSAASDWVDAFLHL